MPGRRHHQVPRLLLKGFTTDGELQFRLRSGQVATVGTTETAVKTHFYSYYDADGVRNTEVELVLRDVDNAFAPVLRRLTAGGPIDTDPAVIAQFVAWQITRSPRFRALDNQLAEVLPGLLAGFDAVAAWTRNRGTSAFNETEARGIFDRARANPPAPYLAPPDPNSSIRLMIRKARELEAALSRVRWTVAESARDSFILGDSPVELFHPLRDPHGFHGTTITPDAEMRLPISPRMVLLGSTTAFGPDRIVATVDLVRSVNTGQARSAHNAIFGTPSGAAVTQIPFPKTVAGLPEPKIRLGPGSGENTAIEFPSLGDPLLDEIIARASEFDHLADLQP